MNLDIRVPKVRVIDDAGEMLGIYQVADAVKLAQEKGFDLIEVAPNGNPPTCKIMDYGKYKYEQKKKAHESRKNQTQVSIKELQLRPRTDQHDLEVKLRHARRFLEEGDKVRFNLRFRGREMAHQKQGYELLSKVTEALLDLSLIEAPPKMEGRQLFTILAPDPIKIKDKKKALAKAKASATPPREPKAAPKEAPKEAQKNTEG